MLASLALTIPDSYAGPLVVMGISGLAALFVWLVKSMTTLSRVVDNLAARMHDMDGKGTQ